MSTDLTLLSADAIDARTAITFVTDHAAGAIDVFLGTTRAERNADEQELVALDYEAYSDMAIAQLRDIAARARGKFPICKLAILHRVGRVNVGEPSVVIAVSCPHRADAFAACRFVIDTLKAEVTIWKKELWREGAATWVQPK